MIGPLIVSLILGVAIYPIFIKVLSAQKVQQEVSEYALDDFKDKKKTVTFGGVLLVLIPIAVTIVMNFSNLSSVSLIVLLVFFAYGLLGFVDDYKIITEGKNDGLKASFKLGVQMIIGFLFYFAYVKTGGTSIITIPIVDFAIDLKLLYLPFIVIMFSAYSNAVNLTDGMDGLAGGTSIIAFATLAFFAYNQQQMELFFILITVIGTLLAFLIFNYKPAKIFMGDVGSLALGALFSVSAVYLKLEVLSLIIGGVFVYETLCVVIQQISWRTRKKRIFKYTPIHYAFTLNGWKEISVVHFFWLLGLVFSIISIGIYNI